MMSRFLRKTKEGQVGTFYILLGGAGAVTTCKTTVGWRHPIVHRPEEVNEHENNVCTWLGEMGCSMFSPTEHAAFLSSNADLIIYKSLFVTDEDMWRELEEMYDTYLDPWNKA